VTAASSATGTASNSGTASATGTAATDTAAITDTTAAAAITAAPAAATTTAGPAAVGSASSPTHHSSTPAKSATGVTGSSHHAVNPAAAPKPVTAMPTATDVNATATAPAAILVDCLFQSSDPGTVGQCVGDHLTAGQLHTCIVDRFGRECFGFQPDDKIRENLLAALGAKLNVAAPESHQAQVLGACLARYQSSSNIASCVADKLTINEVATCISTGFGPECFGLKQGATLVDYLKPALVIAIISQIKTHK
jgi:hypothetical protein